MKLHRRILELIEGNSARMVDGEVVSVGPLTVTAGPSTVAVAAVSLLPVEVGDKVSILQQGASRLVLGKAGTARSGWQPIPGQSGAVSAATTAFVATITPGEYSAVRLRMVGHVSVATPLWLRINADTTTNYRWGWLRRNIALSDNENSATASTRWETANWGTTTYGNTLDVTFHGTDQNRRVTYDGSIAQGHDRRSEIQGTLEASRLVNELRVLVSSGTITCDWTLEGFR